MVVIDETWYVRPVEVPDRIGAGGVVYRMTEAGPVIALIKEHVFGDDQFVLPKGGVEGDESIEVAAEREIYEETGISDLRRRGEVGVLARSNFRKTWWQVSHYFLYETAQVHVTPVDPANYGLAWFRPDNLPPMVWPDEVELIGGMDWSGLG